MSRRYSACVLALIALCPWVSRGQEPEKNQAETEAPIPIKKPEELQFKHPSFTFVRIKYTSVGFGARRPRGLWATDYPDSDLNFSARFEQATGLKTDRQGKVLELTDPALKQYPFIYLAEGGRLRLSDAEVQSLRAYLLDGGFLMADDFWGEAEWDSFAAEMKRVFPDRNPVELPLEHPVFHCFYDLGEKPQVPSIHAALAARTRGDRITWERFDAQQPHYRGLTDDRGRLMALFCHNTDLADGWERETDNAWYYREFSLKRAYPMGINIVVYALTQ